MDRDKLICGCRMVTFGKVLDAIKDGAKSFDEVQARTGLSMGCHRCEGSAKLLVEKLLKDEA